MFFVGVVNLYLAMVTILCLLAIAFIPFAAQIFSILVAIGGIIFYFILGMSSGWLGEIFFPVLVISFKRANYALIEIIYKLWDIIWNKRG